jgi:outer membrane protein assembly factor BamB
MTSFRILGATAVVLASLLQVACSSKRGDDGCLADGVTVTAGRGPADTAPSALPYGTTGRHDGRQPGPGPAGEPTIAWRVESRGDLTAAAVYEGVAFVGTEVGVIALDLVSGRQLASIEYGMENQPEGSKGFEFHPIPAGDTVYIATPFGTVDAIAWMGTRFAEERWSTGLDLVTATWPSIVDGVLYIGTGLLDSGGSLYALDAQTGSTRWRFELPERDPAEGAPGEITVHRGVAYFDTFFGSVYALTAADGERCLDVAYALGSGTDPLAAGDEFLYARNRGVGEGGLLALRADDGDRSWEYEDGSGVGVIAVADGLVVTGTDDRSLCALGARSGEERWCLELGDFSRTDAAVADGVVYALGADGLLYAVELSTGTLLWNIQVGMPAWPSPPVVVDGIVLVTTESGLVAVGG